MPLDGGHELGRLFLAAVTIGVGGVVIGLAWLARSGRIDAPEARVPFARSLVVIAAVSSLGAAAIHYAVAGAHFGEWWGYGGFFVVIAWFQALWALAVVLRASPPVLLVGAGVNAGVAGLWLWTRTIGLPLGPLIGLIEPVGPLDLLATTLELAVVVAALGASRLGPLAPPDVSRVTGLAAQGMAIVLVACATSAALALPVTDHGSEIDHGAPDGSHDPSHHDGNEGLPADLPSSPQTQPPLDQPTRPGRSPLSSPTAPPSPEPSHTH